METKQALRTANSLDEDSCTTLVQQAAQLSKESASAWHEASIGKRKLTTWLNQLDLRKNAAGVRLFV
jgi:hypothetical protein